MRLELTRRTDYAIRAMLVLARNRNDVLSSSDIAERTGIPVRFVAQVMSNLVRANLVRAVLGRSGGYSLVVDPAAVSVLSVVEAVEGDTRRQQCVLSTRACQYRQPCEIHAVFSAAQEAFIGRLGDATLATIIEGAVVAPPGATGRSAGPT